MDQSLQRCSAESVNTRSRCVARPLGSEVAPKKTPRWPSKASRRSKTFPRWPNMASSWFQDTRSRVFPQAEPLGSEVAPKMAPKWSSMVPRRPRSLQGGSAEECEREFPSFRVASRVRTGPQDGLQMVQHGSKKAQGGPNRPGTNFNWAVRLLPHCGRSLLAAVSPSGTQPPPKSASRE